MDESEQLVALFAAHKWVPFAALVIFILVRLQKSGKLPLVDKIPSNYRPFFALGLGILSGVLDKIAANSKTWPVAVLDGLLSAVIAITGHDTIIEGLRSGKELGGGGALNPDPTPVSADSSNAVIPPAPASSEKVVQAKNILLFCLMVGGTSALSFTVGSCALFTPSNIETTGLVGKQIACILEHAFVDDATLNSLCDLISPSQQAEGKQVAKLHRDQLAKEMAAYKVNACMDGGAK